MSATLTELSIEDFTKVWHTLKEYGFGSSHMIAINTGLSYDQVQEVMEFTQLLGWATQDECKRWRLVDEVGSVYYEEW